jgi:membrane-bound metal-dependent hydrolase YbcI (DUF457 family)
VDPVSHAILGRLVTAAAEPPGRAHRGIAAASILGALSPDVDFVLMPFGWDIYLRAHEIGTHSLVGLTVTGLASAGIVRAAARGSRYPILAAAAVAAAASHAAADIISGARLHPGWPLADAVISAPLVAMGDPWPMAILAVGALALWRKGGRRATIARRVLFVLAAFFSVKAVLLGAALRTFDPAASGSLSRVVEARWASLTEWHLFDRSDTTVRQWSLDARGRAPRLLLSWPREADSSLVHAARRLDVVRNFLHVHDLGFVVQEPVEGNRRAVFWSDIRFCWKPESPLEPAKGSALEIACGLWFGGILEPDGRAVSQEVRVGSWVQRRRPPGGGR